MIMDLVKNNYIKTLLLGLLTLLLGYFTIFLPPALNVSYSMVILAFFLVVAFFVMLLLLKWEQLLYIFALSTGFQLYDPSPYEIMLFLLLFMLFVKKVPLNKGMFQNFLIILLFVFLLFGTISIFFSINFYRAVGWHLITVYLVFSALFLALIIKTENQLRFFLKGYIVGAVANSGLGLVGYFMEQSQYGRVIGFFQDPNIFSPYVIIAIMLMIEDSIAPKLFKSKRFKWLSILLMAAAVVLAMSRAGWINLAIALTLFMAVKAVKRQMKPGFAIKVLMIPTLLVLSVHVLFPAVTDSLMNQLEERTTLQYYDHDRFDAQSFALKLAENHPFGIGPGEFTSIYYMDPHNTYYRILAEYGWVSGASLLLLCLFLAGVLLKKSLFMQRREFNLYLVLFCSLVGTFVNISVVDALHWRHFWVLFALCYYVIFFNKNQAARAVAVK